MTACRGLRPWGCGQEHGVMVEGEVEEEEEELINEDENDGG